jgi:hypothetical protein
MKGASSEHHQATVAPDLIEQTDLLHGPGSGTPAHVANGRYTGRIAISSFHLYDLTPPTAAIGALLEEIDRDPTVIFSD